MSTPPKIDRKVLKSPDEFVKEGTKVFNSLVGHRLQIVPVLILVGVGVLAFYGYDWWQTSKAQGSWAQYYEADKAAETEKWDKLKKVALDWPGARSGFLASVKVADHYFDEAKKEVLKDPSVIPSSATTAVEFYTKALQYPGLIRMEKQLLWINRGNSQELSKKWDEAIADYRLAADAGGSIKALALLGSARVYEQKGDVKKAQETYDQVAGEFAANDYGKTARNQVRRLKSSLFTSPKAG